MFHSKAKAGAKIQVYAADGRAIIELQVSKDAVQTVVATGVIPQGVYHLVFVNSGKVEFVKFVKQ